MIPNILIAGRGEMIRANQERIGFPMSSKETVPACGCNFFSELPSSNHCGAFANLASRRSVRPC